MLILPRYKDIFGYFKAISLYRESRYNDTSIYIFGYFKAISLYRESRYNDTSI